MRGWEFKESGEKGSGFCEEFLSLDVRRKASFATSYEDLGLLIAGVSAVLMTGARPVTVADLRQLAKE